MSEYIEREAAIMKAEKYGLGYGSVLGHHSGIADCIASEIATLPAAGVVPVVRCKDCKHFNHERMECENEAVSTDHEGGAEYSLNFWLDDFCSYGERRDGGVDNG